MIEKIKNIISKNSKLIRYIIAGSTATFSNLFALFVLVDLLHIWYLISAVISFCVGVTVSYLLQKFWTFKNYSMERVHRQVFVFFTFNLVMLGFNTLLMYIFVDVLHIWYLLSQAVSAIICAFINYICFNKIIFKNEK